MKWMDEECNALGVRSTALNMGCRIAELERSQHKEIKLKSARAGFNLMGLLAFTVCAWFHVSNDPKSPPRMTKEGPTKQCGEYV